jgi:hypothetical protein
MHGNSLGIRPGIEKREKKEELLVVFGIHPFSA